MHAACGVRMSVSKMSSWKSSMALSLSLFSSFGRGAGDGGRSALSRLSVGMSKASTFMSSGHPTKAACHLCMDHMVVPVQGLSTELNRLAFLCIRGSGGVLKHSVRRENGYTPIT